MNNEKMNAHELCDETLEAVSGGLAVDGVDFKIGERVLHVGDRCRNCSEISTYGVIVGQVNPKRRGDAVKVRLLMECCGNEMETSDIAKV